VTRWYPGVLQSIVDEVKTKTTHSESITSNMSVKDLLAREASHSLESKRNLQVAATKEKTLEEVKKEMGIIDPLPGAAPATTRKRVRQKMRSTPVVGGSLFDDPKTSQIEKPKTKADGTAEKHGGQAAELVVGGEIFKIRVMPETVHRIRSGYSGELLDDSSVKFSSKDVPIEHRLEGFVRNSGLQTISEDVSDTTSNQGSDMDW